jgi:MFS family permease
MRELVMREGILRNLFPSLTHRDFRLLWVWTFVSNVGTWVHNVALGLWVHDVYRSPGWLGVVNFFGYLPVILFFLPAGSMADSLDRRRLLIVTQVVMMVSALALAVEINLGVANLFTVSVTVFAMGTGFALNFPAWQAIMPDLVPVEHLLNAVSLNSASYNLARLLGPMLAGMLAAILPLAACFYVNSISFFPVILALAVVSLPAIPAVRERDALPAHGLTAGLSYAFRNAWSRNLLVTLGFLTFFALPYLVFLPVFGSDILHKGDLGVGVLYAASGCGAVIGAPTITILRRRFDERILIKAGTMGVALSLFLFSLSNNFWFSISLLVVTGASFLAAVASINTILQLKAGREVRGRVMSVYVFMLVGFFPVGGALLGIIADRTGMARAMSIGSLACLFWAVIILLKPELLDKVV